MEYSESDIIKRCKKRDRKAQYVFYKHHFAYLMSICLRYTRNRDEALDVLNLSFAKIMLNLNDFDGERSLNAWMRSITVNTIVDAFRKRSLYTDHIELKEAVYEFAPSADTAIGSNLIEVVQIHLHTLNPTTRSVFNLYAIDGYKHREIAKMLGITEGTSAWHYSEARKALQRFLTPELKLP
ncbi:MAG: RNA polymerase sigma factor [Flavobacteriales bacterium]